VHEIPDAETVIEQHQGWAVIEKNLEVTETVESLDPAALSFIPEFSNPMRWAGEDSNLRPTDYESAALTN
jgi:hypothetical protein